MALRFLEGFDDIRLSSTINARQDILQSGLVNGYGWIAVSQNSNFQIGTGALRTSQAGRTYGAFQTWDQAGQSTGWICCALPSVTEIYIGFGMWHDTLLTGRFCNLTTVPSDANTSAPNGVLFALTSTGAIQAIRNSDSTVLGTSSNTVFLTSTWTYYEIRYVVSSTAGVIEVRANGNTVLNLTGINTATGSLTGLTRFSFCRPVGTGNNRYYDDFYICDSTGPTNNTFLGPIKVYTLRPAGVGSSTQFTPTGAASNWQCVSDNTQDGMTTTVSPTASDQVDSYTIQSTSFGFTPSAIHGVLVGARATVNGTSTIKLRIANALGNLLSAVKQFGGGGAFYNEMEIWETQPDGTTPWNSTAIDSTQIGLKS